MGLIHIYCGDGKGKTTASIGLAIRAAGSGMKVRFIQLLKGNETSELEVLKRVGNISIDRCKKDYGFTFCMSEQEKNIIKQNHDEILKRALNDISANNIDMLIIDEFNAAYQYDLIDKDIAREIIFNKPENLELIITGRNPAEEFVAVADYVSEIKACKHPFEKGIKARKGIEF